MLDSLYRSLRSLPGLKPTDPGMQHITLKFIGDLPCAFDELVIAASCLERRYSDIVLTPLGFGAFPDWRDPNVLWIGLDGTTGLEGLATTLDRAINERCKVPLERRPFKAHLTTARVKDVKKLDIIDVRELHSRALGELLDHGYRIEVKELVLYHSVLTPKGPRYEKLRTFYLSP